MNNQRSGKISVEDELLRLFSKGVSAKRLDDSMPLAGPSLEDIAAIESGFSFDAKHGTNDVLKRLGPPQRTNTP